MFLPREVFHNTSIRVPNQESFDFKIINSQEFTLSKNANVHNKEITLKEIPIGALLVYDVYKTDLDAIKIYKYVKKLDHQDKLAT